MAIELLLPRGGVDGAYHECSSPLTAPTARAPFQHKGRSFVVFGHIMRKSANHLSNLPMRLNSNGDFNWNSIELTNWMLMGRASGEQTDYDVDNHRPWAVVLTLNCKDC